MKTQSDTKLPIHAVLGEMLHINVNEAEIEIKDISDISDNVRISYQYDTAIISKYANRGEIISAIISSVYPTNAEIAIINNKDSNPVKYAKYQSFRDTAKTIADSIVNSI